MKKVLAVTLIAVVALLLTSGGVLAAQSNGPKIIKCDQFIAVYSTDPEPHWRGTLSNCALDGAQVHYFGSSTKTGWESGKVAHFYEDFVILPESGGYIKGYDDGLWTFSTWKFRAEGRVTEASPEWSHLVGYKFHEMGTTDDPTLLPSDPEEEWVLNGPSTMFLAGP